MVTAPGCSQTSSDLWQKSCQERLAWLTLGTGQSPPAQESTGTIPRSSWTPTPFLQVVQVCLCSVVQSRSTLRPQEDRFLCPRDSPGWNTGVGYHFLLQGIKPESPASPGVGRWVLYHWAIWRALLPSHRRRMWVAIIHPNAIFSFCLRKPRPGTSTSPKVRGKIEKTGLLILSVRWTSFSSMTIAITMWELLTLSQGHHGAGYNQLGDPSSGTP